MRGGELAVQARAPLAGARTMAWSEMPVVEQSKLASVTRSFIASVIFLSMPPSVIRASNMVAAQARARRGRSVSDECRHSRLRLCAACAACAQAPRSCDRTRRAAGRRQRSQWLCVFRASLSSAGSALALLFRASSPVTRFLLSIKYMCVRCTVHDTCRTWAEYGYCSSRRGSALELRRFHVASVWIRVSGSCSGSSALPVNPFRFTRGQA